MSIISSIYKNFLEGITFVLTVVTLFTILADFGLHVGIVTQPLEVWQMQYLGFVSAGFGFLNVLSQSFFGLQPVR